MTQTEFRLFNLSLPARLLVTGTCYAAAVAVQLTYSVGYGLLVAMLGWLPLLLASATNKPKDLGLEDWRPVPIAEVDRLDDGLRQSLDLRKKTRDRIGMAAVGWLFILVIALRAATAFTDREDVWLAGLDAVFFLFPGLFFGSVDVFAPPDIEGKMGCFRTFLSRTLPESLVVSPYVRFDKDKSGAEIPEDLRLMLELKRPPADLVGVQIQATINTGPNGRVPYLYAVVLTRGKSGSSYQAAAQLEIPRYVVERGGDGDYGTVVIRREGYATDSEACLELRDICVKLTQSLTAPS
jgi:hypothetical protein